MSGYNGNVYTVAAALENNRLNVAAGSPAAMAAVLPLLALALLAWRLPATPPVAGGGAQRRAPMRRLDPRLRLPQLAAFIAMVSVTIAQVTVGFFAID